MINAEPITTRPAPGFDEAKTVRQKARAAGMNPDYWYAVEYEHVLKKGSVKEVIFWGSSIALYRGEDGRLSAIENRCPHRHLKLSHGVVEGCTLRCIYHGWAFDPSGTLVDYSHDSFGKPMIKRQLKTYPLRVQYGLIWIFPGDPAKADERSIPDIPEVQGDEPWANFTVDFTWDAHHSMIIDNISDFTHAFLHRKYRPFSNAILNHYESDDNRVFLTYDTLMAGGKISGMFVDRERANTRSIELCYEYPYQWSSTGGKIRTWCFLVPVGVRKTRAFFLFYFDAIKIPFLPIKLPRALQELVLKLAIPLVFKPILLEDSLALEAEQVGYDQHWDAAPIEINPVVPLFQRLTTRKWEEFLAQTPSQPVAASEAE
ncbi:Rieske 2Fe-2S domain-containing protein [Candidatus Methylospira mobilis]|uniref:Rieske 2Fe-2S domain-containing protein n=1 Tax=Candidatus Methylospira mobilis TaxID=1808979 RepID=A0A5Q0BBX6_9GAMM|nr:Rieske 2Fe-2S domain-containing protein [Candidatus Methylospira mobilis]QFY41443.1 Rieske 2Fe-2S domain-containing protein [Candidatus Methylospira mobilis]